MRKSRIAVSARKLIAACTLALSCAFAHTQTPPASTAPPAPTLQSGSAASLNDTLFARATSLYDSTAKSGLHGFDCQVHPDWNKMMSSVKKGAPQAADEAKVALLSRVRITLHARLSGSSTLDWELPESTDKPLDPAATSMLDKAHQGMEKTLLGFLKLWTPMVDGSVAESLGEGDASVAQTADGYTLRSKDKHHTLTEEFDRDLLLKHYIAVDSGSIVDIVPTFQPSARGLQLQSFEVRVQPQGAPPGAARELHIRFVYQTVSAIQIPARITVEVPNVVEMDFALDGCTVNAK